MRTLTQSWSWSKNESHSVTAREQTANDTDNPNKAQSPNNRQFPRLKALVLEYQGQQQRLLLIVPWNNTSEYREFDASFLKLVNETEIPSLVDSDYRHVLRRLLFGLFVTCTVAYWSPIRVLFSVSISEVCTDRFPNVDAAQCQKLIQLWFQYAGDRQRKRERCDLRRVLE